MKTKEEAIRLLSVHHADFIEIVKVLAGNNQNVRNYAEDYVQEGYLRLMRYEDLYDKIIKEGKATKGYMFFVLRSIMINDLVKKSNLDYTFMGDEYDMEEKFDMTEKSRDAHRLKAEEIEKKMFDLVSEAADDPDNEISRFDALTFVTYLNTRKSYAKMSRESGVGERTIYLSMTRVRNYIHSQLKADYTDYVNNF